MDAKKIINEIYNFFLDERKENPICNIIHEIKVIGNFLILDMLDVFRYDVRMIDFALLQAKNMLEYKYNIKCEYFLRHSERQKVMQMNREDYKNLNYIIPYHDREKYIDFIYEVNKEAGFDSSIAIAVDNNPYNLKSFLFIETKEPEKFRKIAEKYKVEEYHLGKSLRAYLKDLDERAWNLFILSYGYSKDDIKQVMSNLYYFESKGKLEENGYKVKREYNKVFISYSYKDADKIKVLEDKLKLAGIPIWKDTYEIKFGEAISDKIDEAMKECKVMILCVSENTKNSFYANEEIRTAYKQYIISKEKKVITLVLDDADPKDIFLGLSNYKYANFNDEHDIKKLIYELQEHMQIFI